MRNKMFKKLLVTTLTASMSIGALVGCGEQGATQSSNVVQESESSAVAESPSEEEKEPVELKMIMHSSPAFNEAVEELNAKFTEEYPWITIDLTIETTKNYPELRQTRLAANDVDILEFSSYLAEVPEWAIGADLPVNAEFIEDGLIMDLTGQEFLNNFSQSAIDQACTYKGKAYNVMTGRTGGSGIFYNKAMFKQYNLSEPKTWQEFIDICETLKANGIAPMTSGVKDAWPVNSIFSAIVVATETETVQYVQDLWSGKRAFNDEGSMEIWKKIDQLTPYWEENVASVDYSSVVGRFMSGKAAMMPDGSWTAPQMVAADPNFEFGYFAVPGDEAPVDGGDVQLHGKYDAGFAGAAKTEHPEEVLLWLEFYSRPEVYQEFINKLGLLPVMDDVEITDPFLASLTSKIVDYDKQWQDVFVLPAGVGEYATYYAARFLPVYGGDINTVEELAELANKDWTDAISKIKAAE